MEITEQDIELVHDMVRGMAVDQFKQFGKAPTFFAAVGTKEPEKLEELANSGGLPLKMEQLSKGNGPILVGFYLASVPQQLWNKLMSAVANDIDATALVFTSETWVAEFPNDKGQGEELAAEYYSSHKNLSEYPERKEAIIVNLHFKDKPSMLEVAMVDKDTRELSKFSVQNGTEKSGDITW